MVTYRTQFLAAYLLVFLRHFGIRNIEYIGLVFSWRCPVTRFFSSYSSYSFTS
jgi:hypothetical protein